MILPPTACVTPELDAAATACRVLARLRAATPDAALIVVDDGSSDGRHAPECVPALVPAPLALTMVRPGAAGRERCAS